MVLVNLWLMGRTSLPSHKIPTSCQLSSAYIQPDVDPGHTQGGLACRCQNGDWSPYNIVLYPVVLLC